MIEGTKNRYKWHTSRKRKISGGAFVRPRKKALKPRNEPKDLKKKGGKK